MISGSSHSGKSGSSGPHEGPTVAVVAVVSLSVNGGVDVTVGSVRGLVTVGSGRGVVSGGEV